MDHGRIVGTHPVMRAVIAAVERLARGDTAVLVTGEKGTGKGLVTRTLHALGARAEQPLLRVDCGDDRPDRLLQELCGCDDDSPPSVWRRAGAGTVWLNEIIALPLDIQVRLAARLGRSDGQGWRLVATAQCDAAMALAAGRLSDELHRCLDPIEIPLPALRQRRSDIPLLVDHFLGAYATRHSLGSCRIETEALVHLWQYDWPGNVRELESVVERIVVLSRTGVIRTGDLPPHIPTPAYSKTSPPRAAAAKPVNGAPALRSVL